MILTIIISAVTVFISGYIMFKNYKKATSVYEKLTLVLVFGVIIVYNAIYYLDFYNIPSYLGWTKNINTSDWLNVTFVIIGAIISGISLFIITFWQVTNNNEENRKRDKEDNRIKYMPLLGYKLFDNYPDIFSIQNEMLTPISDKGNILVQLVLNIKNIGLAPIRKLNIEISGDGIVDYKIKFPTQGVLSVNEDLPVLLEVNLPLGKFNWKINVNYQDILINEYVQTIELYIETFNSIRSNRRKFEYSYKVLNETYIGNEK